MILESLALKLLTTLSGYFLEGYLDSLKYNKIDGAPTWYGSTSDKKLVGYGFYKGGIETIEIAKTNCRIDVRKNIDKSIDVIVYDNFKHIKDEKEKEMLKQFKKDENLDFFITKTMSFDKVEHQKAKEKSLFQDANEERTFTQCSIAFESIISYQKERLQKIQKELITFKSNNAFDELESELKN